MQSIDIKSRTNNKNFEKDIEVALREILKEYNITQRTNCDFIRLYFNDTYSIIIKMLPAFDKEAIELKTFAYRFEDDFMMYISGAILLPEESSGSKEVFDSSINSLTQAVLHGFKYLEKAGEDSDDIIHITWNLNEKVDLDDRLTSLSLEDCIKEEDMNPVDFACWIAISSEKFNNVHNNKMYINLAFQIEDEEEQNFCTIITLEEMTFGDIAYTIEYSFPSLRNEKTMREIRVVRAYNRTQFVNALKRAISWYFDLRDVRLPNDKFDFEVCVLRPKFWA